MSNKKKKLLEKYLQKKSKQKVKDLLISQILMIDKNRNVEKILVKQPKNVRKNAQGKKNINNANEQNKNNSEKENNVKIDIVVENNNKNNDGKNIEKNDMKIDNKECNNDTKNNNNIKTINVAKEQLTTAKNSENIENSNKISIHQQKQLITEYNSNELNLSQQDQWIITKKKNNKNKEHNSNEINFNQQDQIITAKNVKNDNEIMSDINKKNMIKDIILVNRKEEIERSRQKLQIYYEESNIISLVRQNTVVVIQSSTGSGKSSQIPQFLYENGFCNDKMIGITQPRRLATIAISKRINEELNRKICGYKIKFEDTTNNNTKIKMMTDGVLLNELKNDFMLTKYSVIVIDEVHERNANIDILIPLLAKIVKVRNQSSDELKLIFMSATLDIKYLKDYFNNDIGVFNLEHKNYKVTTYYEATTDIDYVQKSYEKVLKIISLEEFNDEPSFNSQLIKHKINQSKERLPVNVINNHNSAILVFLPTKNDIYRLKKMLDDSINSIVTIPLHSSLTYKEQKKVFDHYNVRKVILATNIAETSITIPDVVFVIDSGRFKYKTNINNTSLSYKIDFISKASAEQRLGRAGRTSDGVCFRLYSGKVYEQMFDSTIPEIQQTLLDNVILTLKYLGITNIYNFPFLDKINKQKISDSHNTLVSLGALNENGELTDLGIEMSKLPVNPRIARLICVNTNYKNEILLIASILDTKLEISKKSGNQEYFTNLNSDLISKMMIMIDYINAGNKQLYCEKVNLSIKQAEEVYAAYVYLQKIRNVKEQDFCRDYSSTDFIEIQKVIFCTFCDNIAIKSGSEFYNNSNKVYFSSESCHITGEFVVFEYLVIGTSKTYMKNVTQVERDWF